MLNDDLVEALAGPPPKDPRNKCGFREWVNLQTEARQEAIAAAMANPKWKTVDLFKLFQRQGFPRQYNNVRMHRTGSCTCDD